MIVDRFCGKTLEADVGKPPRLSLLHTNVRLWSR